MSSLLIDTASRLWGKIHPHFGPEPLDPQPHDESCEKSLVHVKKRLFIIVQKDKNVLLTDLLPAILGRPGIQILGVAFLVWRFPRSGRLGNGILDRIRLYGLRAWGIRRILDLRNRLRAPLRTPRLEATLKEHRISFCEIDDVNDPQFLDSLHRLSPDLVLNYSLQRYSPELLKIPRIGCVNLHPAPLPEYRGMYPTFWELYNGERKSGVSIHFMNERLDAGPIIATRRFPISPGETIFSLDCKKSEVLPGLLAEALDALVEGRVILQENDPHRGAYYTVPPRETLMAFRKVRGGRWH